MKTILQRVIFYLKSKDTLSWFLATAGVVVTAMLLESIKLHQEVSPSGRYHGDVAGGLTLFSFFSCFSLIVLAVACVVAVFAKSKRAFIGTFLGIAVCIPMMFVLAALNLLLSSVSSWLGTALNLFIWLSLVTIGFARQPKKSTGDCQPSGRS